jgi:hypothetical protein
MESLRQLIEQYTSLGRHLPNQLAASNEKDEFVSPHIEEDRGETNSTLASPNDKHEFVSPHIEEDRGEKNFVPDSWLPVPISELSADTVGVEWLWDQVLAKGHLTDFVGFWKSGKTTLLAALLQRMEHGGELAGRTVRPGEALLVTEEPRAKWLERREALATGGPRPRHQPAVPQAAEPRRVACLHQSHHQAGHRARLRPGGLRQLAELMVRG